MSNPPPSQNPGAGIRGLPVFTAINTAGFNPSMHPVQGGTIPGFPRPMIARAPVVQAPARVNPVTLNQPVVASAPSVMPPKQTTIYVGKIDPCVSEETIKELLVACGPIKSWKRMEDPDTKAPKPFGFCEYQEADGILRALDLLQNLTVGGSALLLKCNTGTQRYIDEILARRKLAESSASKESASQDGDNDLALEKIMNIVSLHSQKLPPPPDSAAAADKFLNSLKSEDDKKKDDKNSRDRHRRESRDKKDDSDPRDQSKDSNGDDSSYRAALRKWEQEESTIHKNLTRERDQEKDLTRERRRLMKADLEFGADDKSEYTWQRKFYAGSRQATERKRWRTKEAQEDEADSIREAEEEIKKEEVAKAAVKEPEDEEASTTAPIPEAPKIFVDPNDDITQAMLKAAKAPLKFDTQQSGASDSMVEGKIDFVPKMGEKLSFKSEKEKEKKGKILNAFLGDEEEEVAQRRELKPITYSKEEQQASQKVMSQKDKVAAIKNLIAQVPTEADKVFGYDINWKAFDEGGKALKGKLEKWMLKKTTEMLGEEEPSMVEFLINQLETHISASKLLEEVQAVLDDEAKPFVFKLYRMIIFETMKQEQSLQD